MDGMDYTLNKTLDDVTNDLTVIRIKNVKQTGFDLRIQECDYIDGLFTESISYSTMEAGWHELPNSIDFEARTFETSSKKAMSFQSAFNHPPVLVCGITTEYELDAVTIRIYNISNNGFDFELQEQETDKYGHKSIETISYIAWEPYSYIVHEMYYIVDRILDDVTDGLYAINFYQELSNSPLFVADIQSRDRNHIAKGR